MQASMDFSITVDVLPGERFALPPEILEKLGPGRWTVTVRPASIERASVRLHDAFLNAYAPEDEGLYDDLAG